MTQHKPSLMISTNEFLFTNAEVGFIKKNFHRKYPAVMGDFIDLVRELMKNVQTNCVDKMIYKALRYYPEGSVRYHISESLSLISDDDQRSHIALQPVETNRKASFGANSRNSDAGVSRLIDELEHVAGSPDTLIQRSLTHNGLMMGFIACQILEFVKKMRDQIVVQENYISLDNNPVLSMDISHKASRSHYLNLCFDFQNRQDDGDL
jgi:hypothetical protein